jgi:aspartate-semialdehyde dehydrogenase
VPALATIERRVMRHYKQIAGKDAPIPSLLLVQAPIFHGHAFSVHIEMQQAIDISKVSEVLAGEHATITLAAEDAPNNVNAAGQNNILVSIVPDAGNANSFWLWAASDNLRIAASGAVECAESMAATRPKGKIQ